MLARAPDEPIPDSLETLLGGELLDSGLLDRLDVISRKMLAGKLPGERRSKRRGASVEFDDFRQYTPGDDLRRIDWNIYARFDRLILKLFREDEDLGVHIVLDASPSMHAGSPNKAIHAHRLAAVLSYLALVSQNRVGLSVLTTGRAGASGGEGQEPALHTLAPARGRQSLVRFTEFLLTSLRDSAGEPDRLPPASRAAVRVSHGDPLGSAIRAACSRTTGKGVFVVMSDLLEPAWLPGVDPGPSHALNALAGGGRFDAHLLQVLSPQELDPASGADLGLTGDVRLTDAETGLAAEVTVTPDALTAYRKRAKAYQDRLEQAAASRGVRIRRCDTSESIGPVLVRTLARFGLLGAPGV